MYLCISFGYYFPSFTTAPHPHPKEETLIKNGCYNLECCSRVLDEQLLAGAAGEVACPVGTGRDGVGVEVVALHRPRQVGSVHVMHVAAGGRVQQVHLAARPLLQEDKFTARFPHHVRQVWKTKHFRFARLSRVTRKSINRLIYRGNRQEIRSASQNACCFHSAFMQTNKKHLSVADRFIYLFLN